MGVPFLVLTCSLLLATTHAASLAVLVQPDLTRPSMLVYADCNMQGEWGRDCLTEYPQLMSPTEKISFTERNSTRCGTSLLWNWRMCEALENGGKEATCTETAMTDNDDDRDLCTAVTGTDLDSATACGGVVTTVTATEAVADQVQACTYKPSTPGANATEVRLIASAPPGTLDQWYYNSKPTCVARGMAGSPCDDDVFVCAGRNLLSDATLYTPDFGSQQEQAEEILKAARGMHGGVHVDCPTLSSPVDTSTYSDVAACEESQGYPQTAAGSSATLACPSTITAGCTGATWDNKNACESEGAVWSPGRQAGTRTRSCDTTGTWAVEVETGCTSSSVCPTGAEGCGSHASCADVADDNTKYMCTCLAGWTGSAYNRAARCEATSDLVAYRMELKGDVCLYLHTVAELFYNTHMFIPEHPMRADLLFAAKEAKCEWAIDEIDEEVMPPIAPPIPMRGDHGPFPRVYNTTRVRVPGYGLVGLSVSGQNQTGKDLYQALKSAIPHSGEYTIYRPGRTGEFTVPVDDDDMLDELRLWDVKNPANFLRAVEGQHPRHGRVGEPIHRHANPGPWMGVDVDKAIIAP